MTTRLNETYLSQQRNSGTLERCLARISVICAPNVCVQIMICFVQVVGNDKYIQQEKHKSLLPPPLPTHTYTHTHTHTPTHIHADRLRNIKSILGTFSVENRKKYVLIRRMLSQGYSNSWREYIDLREFRCRDNYPNLLISMSPPLLLFMQPRNKKFCF